MGTSTLSDVINLIYNCGLEQEDWNTVVKSVCCMIGAKSAGLFAVNLKNHSYRLLGYHNFPVEHLPCSQDHANILPSDISHVSALNIFSNEEYCVRLNIHKATEQAALNKTELHLLQELNPHFERALNFSKMFADLKKNEAVLNSALSKIPLGIVALNKDLKVQFINKMAQAIISNRTDVCLRSNYLVFDDITEHNQLKLAVEKTLKNSCPFISITLGQGGADDALTITLTKSVKKNTHLVNDAELIDDIVVLYLSRPQQAVCISPTVLQDMYKLTPSEANLALCLTNGSSLQSYSSDKQISIQTVRTQLKAVFHKLHVKSQTELVRKLVSSSANLIH